MRPLLSLALFQDSLLFVSFASHNQPTNERGLGLGLGVWICEDGFFVLSLLGVVLALNVGWLVISLCSSISLRDGCF
jgi:hypothetical protein